ncbi:hypothetical protein BCE75_112108 [Isoptericola sp. CG 20/1183]|uniref:DUF308 domain-containing protein n=1 Tax=Isoptericola halotolerans TaxID=300560 RepID=A0ABX5EAD8_9MICO|nr:MULTISPECIES: hypothetical protein [Isoptericola]PRZ03889.1 hypothetical protein BCE75_112108 [Isoptericola sp. CG 20/1183]PRZ03978.1 hypothetical protein BCL65_11112 [Isoptericola halotolerans]
MASPNRDAEPDDLPDADVDARWSDIVARLEDVEQSGHTVEAARQPDAQPDAQSGAEPADSDAAATPARPSGPRDWPTTPEVEALEEAQDHFVPPDPEPVAHREPLLTLAWTVAVAVPVLTVLGVIVTALLPDLSVPAWVGPAGGGSFVAAIAVLVWRMPHRRDPDDHDPGAVV